MSVALIIMLIWNVLLYFVQNKLNRKKTKNKKKRKQVKNRNHSPGTNATV